LAQVTRLAVKSLCCERGGRLVFKNLSFALGAGELLELRGANGVGKSSLLRLLAGFDAPAGGAIEVTGAEPDHASRMLCHYIAHQDAVKPALTLRENLSFWAGFFDGGDVARALEALNLTALADAPSGFLSAGQKRRLALARLSLAWRPIWLLDEPATGLDAASLTLLQRLVKNHLAENGLVIATTHVALGLVPQHRLTLGGM
jgi:heme exporter protein A